MQENQTYLGSLKKALKEYLNRSVRSIGDTVNEVYGGRFGA